MRDNISLVIIAIIMTDITSYAITAVAITDNISQVAAERDTIDSIRYMIQMSDTNHIEMKTNL